MTCVTETGGGGGVAAGERRGFHRWPGVNTAPTNRTGTVGAGGSPQYGTPEPPSVFLEATLQHPAVFPGRRLRGMLVVAHFRHAGIGECVTRSHNRESIATHGVPNAVARISPTFESYITIQLSN